MYAVRRLIDMLFSGLATYRGIGEAAVIRRAPPGLLIIPRYPPPVGLYPQVAKVEYLVSVDIDGRLIGHLAQGVHVAIPSDALTSRTIITFTSVSGEVLKVAEFAPPEGGVGLARALRYFPELRDGRPRRIELVELG